MRIDKLTASNFKGFHNLTLDLHPRFTLLAGDNGSGKTSVLDALAVALGLWHKAAPGSGWRNILPEEVRLEPVAAGDRVLFVPALPTRISVEGRIGPVNGLAWTRMIRQGCTRTTNAEAKDAEAAIHDLVKRAERQQALLPILAYYGAGRAWLPSNQRPTGPTLQRKTQRFDAYRNCLDTRIRDRELNEWFLFEAAAANGSGQGRPGFLAVKQAVLGCIPAADGLRYDSDLKQVVLSIGGYEQPFYNLSAGQRMMLALVADLAIKAVTLNSFLLGEGQPGASDPSELLRATPGIVLIDELDVHLHPKWQRRVSSDLKKTFPNVQFVCTSHSPQVIGELAPSEIRKLDGGSASMPERSFGVDSSRILEEEMDAPRRNIDVDAALRALSRSIDEEDFDVARRRLAEVEETLGREDPDVTRAATLMSFLEQTA